MNQNNKQAYWRANTRLIRNLLLVWAVVSFGFSILLVQPLNNVKLGSVPLGFWMAQQGSIYVFVALIFVYAYQMDKLDRKYLKNNAAQAEQKPEKTEFPQP
jgi:putative solute:sodium symporter small subunit